MLVRHLVDKFNLYYAYRQGCHSRKVHQAAVNQALAAPIISLIYLYYLSFLRIGTTDYKSKLCGLEIDTIAIIWHLCRWSTT